MLGMDRPMAGVAEDGAGTAAGAAAADVEAPSCTDRRIRAMLSRFAWGCTFSVSTMPSDVCFRLRPLRCCAGLVVCDDGTLLA